MGKLNDVRELFWPLLEPLEEAPPKTISEDDCLFQSDDTDILIKYIEDYYQSEEERRKAVESKSAIFIGSFGIAVTALFIVAKEIVMKSDLGLIDGANLFCLAILITYLLRTIWFSIQALERRAFKSVGFPDFLLSEANDKKRKLIVKTYNCIHANQPVINLKVDYMVMAQEYFKRAIVVLGVSLAMLAAFFSYSFYVKVADDKAALNWEQNLHQYDCIASHNPRIPLKWKL